MIRKLLKKGTIVEFRNGKQHSFVLILKNIANHYYCAYWIKTNETRNYLKGRITNDYTFDENDKRWKIIYDAGIV